MNKTLITVGMCLASLTFARAVSLPTQQPQITADDLSWFSGIQYVKGSFDATDLQRPRTSASDIAATGRKGCCAPSGIADSSSRALERVSDGVHFHFRKLTKGQHVLLYGDGGDGATDPKSQAFKVRIVLDVQ